MTDRYGNNYIAEAICELLKIPSEMLFSRKILQVPWESQLLFLHERRHAIELLSEELGESQHCCYLRLNGSHKSVAYAEFCQEGGYYWNCLVFTLWTFKILCIISLLLCYGMFINLSNIYIYSNLNMSVFNFSIIL